MPGPDIAPQPMTVAPVSDTATFANARPTKVPPVMVTEPPVGLPARMLPLNSEVVMVTPALGAQYTLHGCPPPAITTEKLVPVRAAPILKIHTAVAGFALPVASSVNTPAPVSAVSVQ